VRVGAREGWRVLLAVTAAAVGFLVAFTALGVDGIGFGHAPSTVRDLVTGERRSVDALAATDDAAARSRPAGQTATGAAGTAGATHAAAAAALAEERLAAAAGLTAVHGPGITVALNDAPPDRRDEPPPPGIPAPTADDLVVHQQDVQGVVNALWTGGAEAMTVMGVRVTALSSVRCVGNTLLMGGKVYSPPFTVAAIGDTDSLLSALTNDPQVTIFREYVDAYGLGYDVRRRPDLRMPAYTGSVALTDANPT
jgi:uncharacterized protein YlxW (UPF0749 family)